jgi:hypothetical protein
VLNQYKKNDLTCVVENKLFNSEYVELNLEELDGLSFKKTNEGL